MTYEPDPDEYQQLHDGDPTGAVDCTAESSCWVVDATTSGAVMLQPSEVRRASNEPVPDPHSPGLNLEQARDSVLALTDGRVRLDVQDPVATGEAQRRISAGEWAVVQIDRGVLASRGIVSGFSGPHAVTAHFRLSDRTLWMGDPLVPGKYVQISWANLWAAAEAFASPGRVRVALVPGPVVRHRWHVRHGARVRTYTVSGGHIAIKGDDYTWTGKDSSAPCSAPRRMTTASGSGATVVELLDGPRQDDVVRVQRPGTYVEEIP